MMTTADLLRHADMLAVMNRQLLQVAQDFDKTGSVCECCSAVRYKNFPQKQMRERIEGAAQRLEEIVGVLLRRKEDPVFLNGGDQ